MTHRYLAAMLMAASLVTGTGLLAAPGNGNGNPDARPKMFGKNHPFVLGDLPRGRLRDRIESLPSSRRQQSLEWLHGFDFPEKDVQEMEVDDEGAVLYVDPAPVFCDQPPCEAGELPADPALAPTADAAVADVAAAAADDAFALHSRPGAPHVVYLDFDGHSFSGTAWGSGTVYAAAFDLDGNPASFSAAERTAIAEIWHRVAEDFAAFDIDVTTERPASFGPYTGRVLITSKRQTNGQAMPYDTAGGVAYIGVWGRSNYASYYSPALVYYDNLAKNATYIAEASAHEFGHNLGLSHDGTSSVTYYAGHGSGATSWAPIMGNSYSRNVTQWSKGEYAGANNTQDDIAIIADALFLADDDHGDTPAAASALSINGNGEILVSDPEIDPNNLYPENKGVIDSSADWDYFSFYAGAGTVDIRVNPAWQAFYRDSRRGANLDVRAVLFDARGNLVAESDPATDTYAGITTSIPEGTYFLGVTGAGNGNYSNYASQGQYFISGTVASDPNTPPTADFGSACQGLTCSFVDSSTDSDGSVVGWSWGFGDGSSASGQNPSHSYSSAGTYTVTLTVTDDDGDTATTSQSVTVTGGGGGGGGNEDPADMVWVEDSAPAGSGLSGTWNWITGNPAPYSGAKAHQSALASGLHQHYFAGASDRMTVSAGDTLFTYVYLDPANPPREIMLQWNDGDWNQRAYWGENLIGWGTNGSVSRRYMGPLPATGQWVRLEVPASAVGLEGRSVNGMAFTLYGGRVAWDRTGLVQQSLR